MTVLPNNIAIHIKVAMHQAVSHSSKCLAIEAERCRGSLCLPMTVELIVSDSLQKSAISTNVRLDVDHPQAGPNLSIGRRDNRYFDVALEFRNMRNRKVTAWNKNSFSSRRLQKGVFDMSIYRIQRYIVDLVDLAIHTSHGTDLKTGSAPILRNFFVLVIGIGGGNRKPFNPQMSNGINCSHLTCRCRNSGRSRDPLYKLKLPFYPPLPEYRSAADNDAIDVSFS